MEGRVSRISKELMINKKEYKKQLEKNHNWNGSDQETQLKTEIAEAERTLKSLRVKMILNCLIFIFYIFLVLINLIKFEGISRRIDSSIRKKLSFI